MAKLPLAQVPYRVRKDLTGFIKDVVNDRLMFLDFLRVDTVVDLEEFFWNKGFTDIDDFQGLWDARKDMADGMSFTLQALAETGKHCY
ncbi:MAG: hypothetical protein HY787_17110 [Deltaproteobacteria bacterium]|nr:hypothetical protein [Deltaproteobacteria bacterium]